ncbi:MAG: argininosuccinate lyase [Acidobacteria bacterium]|nr:argininosuccinate lyase [Acidobacteriota bacterium]MBI3655489.1 argininosuccinate lyase [Acidobacteriota bacterium]
MVTSLKLWGGRFKKEIDPEFARFNASFRVDQRLLREDIEGSLAYAEALAAAKVLTPAEAERIRAGLLRIRERSLKDPAFLESNAEDVHSFVEERLFQSIGRAAFKLHTGRSRNEQVSLDMRLFCRRAILTAQEALINLAEVLIELARKHESVVIPGYTHLQKAQPILFPHYLLAYYEMFKRDFDRLTDCARRVNVSPLGCGAIAGTSYPIDRRRMAHGLGFSHVALNSLDAVSDRDFVAELIFAASLTMVHLSRLAEDLIIYSTSEFAYIILSDAVSTGSSLMPQKKNPDSLELIRGKCPRVLGHLLAILTLLKGLPTSYNKDMQEDKEALFNTVDTVQDTLTIMTIVLRHIDLNLERIAESLKGGYLLATDLADYLVKKGLEFRKAHEVVGQVVLYAVEKNKRLEDLTHDELRSVSNLLGADVLQVLTIEASLAARHLVGGTSRKRVKAMLKRAEKEIAGFKRLAIKKS